MTWNKIVGLYWAFAYFTIPLTILLLYWVTTELLDLIFNTVRINKLLKHSDNIEISALEDEYLIDKKNMSNCNKSNLIELEKQIDYIELIEKEKKSKWFYSSNEHTREKIVSAKEITDIFKIN